MRNRAHDAVESGSMTGKRTHDDVIRTTMSREEFMKKNTLLGKGSRLKKAAKRLSDDLVVRPSLQKLEKKKGESKK